MTPGKIRNGIWLVRRRLDRALDIADVFAVGYARHVQVSESTPEVLYLRSNNDEDLAVAMEHYEFIRYLDLEELAKEYEKGA